MSLSFFPATAPAKAEIAPERLTRTVLRAKGFSCPSCVRSIEGRVGALDGVAKVEVQFVNSKIVIDHDPEVVSVDELVRAVADAGHESAPSAF